MIDLRFPTALQMVLSVALADRDGFRCTSQILADGLSTNPSFIRKLLVMSVKAKSCSLQNLDRLALVDLKILE